MKQLIIIFLVFSFQFLTLHSFAQTVLLEQDVNADTIPAIEGPNMKNYNHWYMSYGFVLGNSEGDGGDVLMGISGEYLFGLRYKRKINNNLAIGLGLHYGWVNYFVQQDSSKTFPNSEQHKTERLVYNNIGAEGYFRINYGKRGNHIGNFFDLGAYGEWGYLINHITKDKHDPAQVGAGMVQVKRSRLQYVNRVNYGAMMRVGFNRYVLYGKYRLSNLFKEDYPTSENSLNYPEFPRIVAGIEIGLFE
ncbi:MAG: hypothetical protein COA57_03185 [Flavobacteriales bacterium]|nr:MAG: hypothetical protein COA57_03185 [Flavobacteriales bacterium]